MSSLLLKWFRYSDLPLFNTNLQACEFDRDENKISTWLVCLPVKLDHGVVQLIVLSRLSVNEHRCRQEKRSLSYVSVLKLDDSVPIVGDGVDHSSHVDHRLRPSLGDWHQAVRVPQQDELATGKKFKRIITRNKRTFQRWNSMYGGNLGWNSPRKSPAWKLLPIDDIFSI